MLKIKLEDFFDFFDYQFYLLEITGIRFDGIGNAIKRTWLQLLNKLLITYCILTFIWNQISLILCLFLIQQEVEQKLSGVIIILANFESALKLTFFCLNFKVILKILEDLKVYYRPGYKYLIKEAKIILLYSKFSVYITRVPPFLELINGFIALINGVWIGNLPSMQWYPFDSHDIKYYYLVFFNQITMGVTALAYLMGTDGIFMMIYAHINQQFTILAHDFSELDSNNEELKRLVKRHSRLTE